MLRGEIRGKILPDRTGRHFHPGLLIFCAVVTGGLVLMSAGRLFSLRGRSRPRSAEVPSRPMKQPSNELTGTRRLPTIERLPEAARPLDVAEESPETTADEAPRIRVDNRSVAELWSLARATNDSWLKADIIEELEARRGRDGVAAIVEFLHDRDPDVRRVAVDALADLEAQDQVPAVRAVLVVETNREVRAAMDAMLREVAGH